MKVLEVYAGTGSGSAGFVELGAEVVGVEIDPKHGQRLTMDALLFAEDPCAVLDLMVAPGWRPEVILYWPPCTCYTLAAAAKGEERWTHLPDCDQDPFYGPRVPRTPEARQAVRMVLAIPKINAKLKPKFWKAENPQGGLQTMKFMEGWPGGITTSYCAYGDTRQKMTTFWGVWPEGWKPLPKCSNGDPCHEAAPRGSKTGTQGLKNAVERGRVPIDLSRDFALACYAALKESPTRPAPVGIREKRAAIGLRSTPVKRGSVRMVAGHSGTDGGDDAGQVVQVGHLPVGAGRRDVGGLHVGGEVLDGKAAEFRVGEQDVADAALGVEVLQGAAGLGESNGSGGESARHAGHNPLYTPQVDNPAYTPMPTFGNLGGGP